MTQVILCSGVDKTFPGKLLRRVEITGVALVGGALFCFGCLSHSLTLPLASHGVRMSEKERVL